MDDDLERVYKEVAEEAQNYVSIIIRTGTKHTKQIKQKQIQHNNTKTKQSGKIHEAPRVKTSSGERQRRRNTRKREGSGQDI